MREFFDTIAAIATPPGKGSISVVKLSGSKALEIAKRCFISKTKQPVLEKTSEKQIIYGFVKNLEDDTIIDECLLLVMKSPKSYTGEDVVEFQCHGGSISSYKIIKQIFSMGARQAAPGEFTLRAFINGKIDLVQAEAINSLVNATNEFLHENAVSQLKGELSVRLNTIFEKLQNVYLSLEAEINFPDDVDNVSQSNTFELLTELKDELMKLKDSYLESMPLREGIKAVILGKPNVGKSTFLNKMLNYERAIVTPHPGTTRDFILEQLNFCGYSLNIIDTAGIRETQDPVEKIGIEKTLTLVKEADIIFLILDASKPLENEDLFLIETAAKKEGTKVFCLLNKIDKGFFIDLTMLPSNFIVSKLSLKTEEGFNDFKEQFRKAVLELYCLVDKRDVYLIMPRHYEIITEMLEVIDDALASEKNSDRVMFSIKELISLYESLIGKKVAPDEINEIFSKFCIGK